LTPNIDRLARESVKFEYAITGGSWTQAAFPVLLTSTYASMFGGCLGPLSKDRPSPIESLARNGYQTHGFSTNHLLSRKYGYDRGFHTFTDLVPEETDPVLRQIKGGENLLRRPVTHSISNLVGVQTRPARTYVSGESLVDAIDRSLPAIQEPFFIWAHFMDTHWPYHIEESLQDSERIAQAWRDLVYMHRINRKGYPLTPEMRDHFLYLYKAALQYTDLKIGSLVASLEDHHLRDETIIVLISDHGEEFKERNYWGHFEVNLFDEILRVPWLINLPGKESGQTIGQQVRTLDLMPTILDLCGVVSPEGVEGTSVAPLWDSFEKELPENVSISEMWRVERHIVAVRTSSYKFIWDSASPDDPQLFDLIHDPGELQNIAGLRRDLIPKFQATVEAHLEKKSATSDSETEAVVETDQAIVQRLRDLGYMD
jgi:arylsulfatase A-like enzyme